MSAYAPLPPAPVGAAGGPVDPEDPVTAACYDRLKDLAAFPWSPVAMLSQPSEPLERRLLVQVFRAG